MKKYFIRIIAVLLMTTFLPVVSDFCFSGLLYLVTQAHASSISDQTKTEIDTCGLKQVSVPPSNIFFASSAGLEQVNVPQSNIFLASATLPVNNHNSILACCVGGNSPSTTSLLQFDKIGKYVPINFFVEKTFVKLISKKISYHSVIIPPPELSSIKATILRI